MASSDTIDVACEHCRARLTIGRNPEFKKFRCAECQELTPITVGIALARNLDEEKRQADRRERPARTLLALIAIVIGLFGIAGGTYMQLGGCSAPQSSYTTPRSDTTR